MTSEETPLDLYRLEALIAKATAGKWVSQGPYISTPSYTAYIGEVRDQDGNWSDTPNLKNDAALIVEAVNALPALIAELRAAREIKPHTGDLWWNNAKDEEGFLCVSDAFEDANPDCEDYSVELHRALSLPPVWAALIWVDGEQVIKVFATEAEADAARALNTGAKTDD
jgi:hypothetical protein